MSPWTVYWVMQADSIADVLTITALVSGITTVAASFFWAAAHDPVLFDEPTQVRACARKAVRGAVAALVLSVLGVTFWPSTKTICAMIAVPAIANNDKLQADALDIYKLGMERLKEALSQEEAK